MQRCVQATIQPRPHTKEQLVKRNEIDTVWWPEVQRLRAELAIRDAALRAVLDVECEAPYCQGQGYHAALKDVRRVIAEHLGVTDV